MRAASIALFGISKLSGSDKARVQHGRPCAGQAGQDDQQNTAAQVRPILGCNLLVAVFSCILLHGRCAGTAPSIPSRRPSLLDRLAVPGVSELPTAGSSNRVEQNSSSTCFQQTPKQTPELGTCPVCGLQLSADQLQQHVEQELAAAVEHDHEQAAAAVPSYSSQATKQSWSQQAQEAVIPAKPNKTLQRDKQKVTCL